MDFSFWSRWLNCQQVIRAQAGQLSALQPGHRFLETSPSDAHGTALVCGCRFAGAALRHRGATRRTCAVHCGALWCGRRPLGKPARHAHLSRSLCGGCLRLVCLCTGWLSTSCTLVFCWAAWCWTSSLGNLARHALQSRCLLFHVPRRSSLRNGWPQQWPFPLLRRHVEA